MKKFFNGISIFILSIACWRFFLFLVERMSLSFPIRPGFLGPVPWANFDGVHYLLISEWGYHLFSEAFFPGYPLFIRWVSQTFHIAPHISGMGISLCGFLIGLYTMYILLRKQISKPAARWVVIFAIVFPTSFYFASVYTEGLFFALSIACFYYISRKRYMVAGMLAGIASGTRIVGVFLLIPFLFEFLEEKVPEVKKRIIIGMLLSVTGLFGYMYFQYVRTGDPFIFFHVQPEFGAGRSGSSLILLPQVLYRYGRMIVFAVGQPTWPSYVITIFELCVAILSGWGIYILFRIKKFRVYAIYCLALLLTPTLTGTLSSMPRYVLGAFPLLIPFAMIVSEKKKFLLALSFLILQSVFAVMFLRGWFVG